MTLTNTWLVECIIPSYIDAKSGGAWTANWLYACRPDSSSRSTVRAVPQPENNTPGTYLSLDQAIALGKEQAKLWSERTTLPHVFRLRNVETGDIIMVDIL